MISSKNFIFKSIIIATIILFSCCSSQDSVRIDTDAPWSKRIAESFIYRHPDAVTYDTGSPSIKWNYEQGLILFSLYQMYLHSGEDKYFEFIKNNLDHYVEENGNIKTYDLSEFNIDHIGPGRALLAVYQSTDEHKYRAAADSLRRQLREHPRTNEGGFWHKKIYPFQMWLDGLYMAGPFYSKYAMMFNEKDAYDDIANQFIWIAQHTRDSKTGLLYHAWDESREQRWANPQTGCSPNFWARAMGWYMMAIVDVMDYFPLNHPKREEIIAILTGLAEALMKFRDEKTFLWYQVVDQCNREGNYLETSASCMFAYSFAKGVNKGYLDRKFFSIAAQTFQGIIEHKVTIDANGFIDLHGTCRSAGLGGKQYRDGSFEYYISEPQRTNDMKGIGPFLLAAIEIEKGKQQK